MRKYKEAFSLLQIFTFSYSMLFAGDSLVIISISFCCVINHPKLSSLKQYKCITFYSSVCWQDLSPMFSFIL